LHCSRSNTASAKFCVECGAALLRKFCPACHATNDAESRFCQACGNGLPPGPQPPSAAATQGPPVMADVPDLTDVVSAGSLGAAPLVADAGAGALVELPALQPAATVHEGSSRAATGLRPYRLPVLAGLGALCMAALAIWSWPGEKSTPATEVRPVPDLGAAKGAGAPRAAAVDSAANAAVSAAARALEPYANPASGTAATAPRALEATANKGVREARDAVIAAGTRRGSAAATGAAGQKVQSTPDATERPAATRVSGRPAPGVMALPPGECTAARDALALCAPGTNIVGR
jgi:Double zinc ribbon